MRGGGRARLSAGFAREDFVDRFGSELAEPDQREGARDRADHFVEEAVPDHVDLDLRAAGAFEHVAEGAGGDAHGPEAADRPALAVGAGHE